LLPKEAAHKEKAPLKSKHDELSRNKKKNSKLRLIKCPFSISHFSFLSLFFGICTKKQINDTKLKYSFFKELSTCEFCLEETERKYKKKTLFKQSSLSLLLFVKLWRIHLNKLLEEITTKS
jgi:hypothetical protein